MIFFSADLHFNHFAVIGFCDRPFKTIEDMNEKLINNINQRCKPYDTLYHIGDFAFKGGRQGGKLSAQHFENQINCKVIHILGNHDKNNHLKNSMRYGEIWFANRRWCLQHKPPEVPHLRQFPVDLGNDVYLVGHVHEKWKSRFIGGKLVINLGCDVWNYRPISQQELTVYADKMMRENE